ncbi:DUF5710 domain-containing protein (plasmid) [Acinetobacter sp. ESL0695]|nr:DUF5710 domain-containing protein [Acinetobacter sp. ESL0695]WEV50260.1 DUF5710 domain-containing protein [Acinetobacter sp. ESL0695]
MLLDVPFSEKNEAREAGAKWDKNEKSWFIMSDQLDLAHNKWIKTDSEDKQNLETMDNVSTKEEKTYINVPFSEKNEAREAGAKWDKNEKSWFIPENVDTTPFEKWLPKDEDHTHTAKLSLDESNFLKELAEAQGYENVGYLILYSVNQKEVGSFTPVSELQSDQEIEEASKNILNLLESGSISQENKYITDTITDLKNKYHFNEMYINEDANETSNEASNQVKNASIENNSKIQATKEKTYINVPFSEKNEAREAGAKWDKNEKSWFIPENVDTTPFEKWIEVRDLTTEAIKDITSVAQEELGKSLQPNFSDMKIFLAVAYEDREIAKEAGAMWDKEAKCWYAPEGSDMMLLNKWLPENQPSVDSHAHANNTSVFQTNIDPISQFRQALQEAGLKVDNPQMDGKLYRVPLDDDKGSKRNGAYKGNLNGLVPSGFIQNFKTGLKENWKADGKIQGTVNTAKLQAEAAQRNFAIAQKREAMYEQVAHKAELLISYAEPLVNHKYLDKKQVSSHGLLAVPSPNAELEEQKIFIGNTYKETKQLRSTNTDPEAIFLTKNDIMIPSKDIDGKVWTIQTISENGFKSWLKGGKKQGNFFTIGNFENGKPILEAEGYATGATLHEVTGRPVAVSFDSGNLTSIAIILKEQFKDSIIYVAGDNDIESLEKNKNMRENVGVEKATQAANAVNGHVIIPKVRIGDGVSDWNDIAVKRGNQHVKAEIKSILESINQKQEKKQENISQNENIHKLQRETSNIKESRARSITR